MGQPARLSFYWELLGYQEKGRFLFWASRPHTPGLTSVPCEWGEGIFPLRERERESPTSPRIRQTLAPQLGGLTLKGSPRQGKQASWRAGWKGPQRSDTVWPQASPSGSRVYLPICKIGLVEGKDLPSQCSYDPVIPLSLQMLLRCPSSVGMGTCLGTHEIIG